jgi:8-hydroxy-5-deazaflavin:NADPH oxidoreductase
MKKIAVLGSGQVGETLSNGFLKHGYAVMRASRDPAKLSAWQSGAGAEAEIGTFEQGARWADAVVLAVKGDAAEAVIAQAGIDNLRGKPVLDTTNPIAALPPQHGVLRYFTTHDESLMERLQKKAPEAHFVKVFSCVGNALMVNPNLPGGPPSMFICGNDAGAKAEVKTILRQFGWEIEDMGSVEAARAIEPLCMLWCIPGLSGGSWMHAFKLLKPG